MPPLAAAALALALVTAVALSGAAAVLARRLRAAAAASAELAARLDELTARLEASEQDVACALARSGIAETVLLDKGVADEDDLEAARRRFDEAGADASRDGDLH